MLPPGHVGAGFLVGVALLKVSHISLTQAEETQIILWTMFFSFAPDLDTFWYFFKNRNFLVIGKKGTNNHRSYLSHVPVLWVLVGLGIVLSASSQFWKMFGLALWFGSWSHFLLDSLEYGIMWLWPVNKKLYALKNVGVNLEILENNFFKHTFLFLKAYSNTLTFIFEILIIILALIIYFKLI